MSLRRHPIYTTRKKQRLQNKAMFRRCFKAGLGFLTSAASIFCLLDGLVFAGVMVTLSSFFFVGFAAIGAVVGVLYMLMVLYDDNKQVKEEASLRDAYNAAFKERESHISRLYKEITELKNALTNWKQVSCNTVQFEKELRELDGQLIVLQCNATQQSIEEADKKIKDLHDYFKLLQAKIKSQSQNNSGEELKENDIKHSPAKEKVVTFSLLSKRFGNRFMTFLGAAGTPIGIASTVVGVMTNPIGWMILAGVCVVSIIVGAVALYLDYKLSRTQERALAKMADINSRMTNANIEMSGMVVQVGLLKELVTQNTKIVKAEQVLEAEKVEKEALQREVTGLRAATTNGLFAHSVIIQASTPSAVSSAPVATAPSSLL